MEEKILIAHRGNIDGRIAERENHPDYVRKALSLGYHAEIDIHYVSGKLYLGHDNPQFEIDFSFLFNANLWVHCKNIEVMELLVGTTLLNFFAHEEGIIITLNGYLWTAPGLQLTNKSIAVMPEMSENWNISNAIGICTDYPKKYK